MEQHEGERARRTLSSPALPSRLSGAVVLVAMVELSSCGLSERYRETPGASDSDSATLGTVAGQTSGAGGSSVSGGDRGGPLQLEVELPEPGTQEGVISTKQNFTDMALHDDTAVLGGTGQVVVFAKDGADWVEQLNWVPEPVDYSFGSSVALFDDTLLVGEPLDAEGSVCVFERQEGSWSETQRLQPSDGTEGEGFGTDVALSGATALVGTKGGAAYVFTREGDAWSEAERLVPREAEAQDFGAQVALEGDTAVIGAYDEDGYVAPYVFVRDASGWSEQQRLVVEQSAGNTRNRLRFALSGDTMLVAASHDRAVYVFSREDGEWHETQALLGPDTDESFAGAVAMHGDLALVAAFENFEGSGAQGKVYAFERVASGWSRVQELSPSELELWSARTSGTYSFGTWLAVDQDAALIAASGYGQFDAWYGSVYVFTP